MADRFSPINDMDDGAEYRSSPPRPALQDYLQQAYQMLYGDRTSRPVPPDMEIHESEVRPTADVDMEISEDEVEGDAPSVTSESIGRGYVIEGDDYDNEGRHAYAEQLAEILKTQERENQPSVAPPRRAYAGPGGAQIMTIDDPESLNAELRADAEDADMREFLSAPAMPIARTAPFESYNEAGPEVDIGEAEVIDEGEMEQRAKQLREELARVEAMIKSHGKNTRRSKRADRKEDRELKKPSGPVRSRPIKA